MHTHTHTHEDINCWCCRARLTVGVAVVGVSDTAETLLSSSVPDLQEEEVEKDGKNKKKR